MAQNSLDPSEALSSLTEIMSAELEKLASEQIINTNIEIAQTEAEKAPQQVQNSLDNQYQQLIGPNEQVVGYLPKGSTPIKTFGRTRAVADPKSGETVLVDPIDSYQQATIKAPHSDAATVQKMFEEKQSDSVIKPFNPNEEMNRLSLLKGEEHVQAIGQLRLSAYKEIARERDAIRRQAQLKSGLTAAEAALKQNLLLDQQKGGIFLTQDSAQTVQARRLFDSATDSARRYEASLVESSQRVGELTGFLKTLESTEQVRANRESQQAFSTREREARYAQSEELARQRGKQALDLFYKKEEWKVGERDYRHFQAEEGKIDRILLSGNLAKDRQNALFAEREAVRQRKIAALRSTVSDRELTNYHLVYGSSGNDNEDRSLIVARRNKDPVMADILTADNTSILNLLSSDDRERREKGFKLIHGADTLAADPTLTLAQIEAAPPAPIVRLLRGTIDKAASFKLLIDDAKAKNLIDSDLAKEFSGREALGDAKEKERLRANLIQRVMQAQINQFMESRVRDDVRQWKVDGLIAGNPLHSAMISVRTKDGRVPLSDSITGTGFVQSVIYTDMKNVDGTEITFDQKLGMIQNAIQAAVVNGAKSILFPADTALIDRLQAEAVQAAQIARVTKALNVPFRDPRFSKLEELANTYGQANLLGSIAGRF